MRKLRYFNTPAEVLDYIAFEFVETLNDDARANGNEPPVGMTDNERAKAS